MKNQWYLSKDKQVSGPIEKEKIISLIQNRKLVHLDLLYKDEASGWKPLFQIEEFAPYLNNQGDSPELHGDAMEWVLLKKIKIRKGVEYKQIGPFSVAQVLNRLDSGELDFDDLAWKKNFESWVPISQLETFKKPLPSSPLVDPDLYKTNESQKKGFEDSGISLTGKDIDRYFHEPEMTSTAPINTENFVTESRINPISSRLTDKDRGKGKDEDKSKDKGKDKPTSGGDNESYPLEFTGESQSLKLENTPLLHEFYKEKKRQNKNKSKGVKTKEPKIREKEKKTFKDNKGDKGDNKMFNLDIEIWQWVALAVVLILLAVFLYLLF